MASSSTFPAMSVVNRIVNFGGTHGPIAPGSFPLGGVSSTTPIRSSSSATHSSHIGTGRRLTHSHASSVRNCCFRQNNGQIAARPRKKSGDQTKLRDEVVGSRRPSSYTTTNVQDRLRDISTEDSVLDDVGQEDRTEVNVPESVCGVQEGVSDQALYVPKDMEVSEEEEVQSLLLDANLPLASPEDTIECVTETGKEEQQQELHNMTWEEVESVLEVEKLREHLIQEVKDRKAEEDRRIEVLKQAVKLTFMKEKIFHYPDPAVAAGALEIYLNRSETTLAAQSQIFIRGAFNEWKWKPFVAQLSKTDLPGDWWSCKIEVPNEVYKVDCIFSDGQDLYENNSKNDFFISVENGMSKEDFVYFLLEEKVKEERLLREEKAEKEQIVVEERRLVEQKAAEEVDRAQAKVLVAQEQETARGSLHKAVKRVDKLWFMDPPNFGAGECVTLYYNRSSRPLSNAKDVWIHGGYNNWKDMVSIVKKLSPEKSTSGDWWSVKVDVPMKAYMLNWVLADGPPENAGTYDNNDWQDFHALIPKTVPEDTYWGEVEEEIYMKLQKERKDKAEAAKKKAEHQAALKAELKAKTKQTFLQAQAHIFFTEPAELKSGDEVTVFYNPSNTLLNGKPEVYIRGSFNRWTHFLGCFGPIRMVAADNGTHLKATVKVPKDAYMLDFVFSEREDDYGGLYDNKNGLDYHVPVTGGLLTQPPLDIIHIAVEMAPIAKVGGLGDVVTSLSRAVQEMGHNVDIILPKYDCLNYNDIEDLKENEAFSFGGTRVRVWTGKVKGLSVHFLEPENGFFWAGCIYGRRDDGARFGFFCHAALEYLQQRGRNVDIIHCHDWTSAPVAWLFGEGYQCAHLADARIVFSIHNLEFGAPLIGRAMENAHMATTVSPTYAAEVSGNGVIAPHLSKFHGIRNGIDPEIWDPYTDPFIPVAFTSENVTEGKRAAKEELRRRLGLRHDDRPVLGIITRLTAQKGIHLIKHGIYRTLERGGQVVLLGSAPDPRIQNEFVGLSNQLSQSHGDMARLCLSYDEPLSHLIYAGADFILIPSIFEPCGLTQLIAMRYGSIPIVRKTGGLNDTIFDIDNDRDRAREAGVAPNGFSFESPDAAGVDYALNRALSAWYEARGWFQELCKQVMEQDWTWNRPALDYIELYYGAKKKP